MFAHRTPAKYALAEQPWGRTTHISARASADLAYDTLADWHLKPDHVRGWACWAAAGWAGQGWAGLG